MCELVELSGSAVLIWSFFSDYVENYDKSNSVRVAQAKIAKYFGKEKKRLLTYDW